MQSIFELLLHYDLQSKEITREASCCETCANYVYDEDYEYYVCDMDLDEDEMYRFLSGSTDSCPYYQLDNEYLIVRKQMWIRRSGKTMPLVTLIIPVYNAERYLRRCLDSVAAQTFTDMEVLLMNDGSTDGSLAICKEYEEKDLRFHTIDKENSGVSNTRILP